MKLRYLIFACAFIAHQSISPMSSIFDPAKSFEKAGTAVADKLGDNFKQAGQVLVENLQKTITVGISEVKTNQIEVINYVLNKVRLAPGYIAGTTLLIAAVNLYQKALNDYFNTIDTKAEALQALRKKIKWKLIAGCTFTALGIATLYNNQILAQYGLGYNPNLGAPTEPVKMPALTRAEDAITVIA